MNLCEFMLERGVTTHELAKIINVTNEEFCSKLQGTLPWDLVEVVTICDHFNTVDLSLFSFTVS